MSGAMSKQDLSPQEYITELYKRTDKDGILTLSLDIGPSEEAIRFRMNWNLERYRAVLGKFTKVYEAIQKIGHIDEALWWQPDMAKIYLNDAELYRIWLTYLCEFDTPLFCEDKINEIHDRLQQLVLARELAQRFADGQELSNYDRKTLEEGLKIEFSDEDLDYFNDYYSVLEEQSKVRLGKNIYAYETILFAQRLCRLIELGSSKAAINHEARKFAECFVLHEYAAEIKDGWGNKK